MTGPTFTGGISNAGTISGNVGILFGSGVSTFLGAIVNSGAITGTGGTAIDVSQAHNAITIDQTAGLISGAIKLSANADILNISGGTIAGNIVGPGLGHGQFRALGAGTTYTDSNTFTGHQPGQYRLRHHARRERRPATAPPMSM